MTQPLQELQAAGTETEDYPCVLAVDDDRVMLASLVTRLKKRPCRVHSASNGEAALEVIHKERTALDVILLDREMPVMDGMEVLRRIRMDDDLARIPIIMQTGADKPDQVKEGIDAGVFYYLTKPFDNSVLNSVLSSAIEKAQQAKTLNLELGKHRSSFAFFRNCEFEIRTLGDAEDLACFLANCFPDPERALSGLAELLTNAVEHGNLGIGYAGKTDLIAKGIWRQEVERRLEQPEHRSKLVRVFFNRTEQDLTVTIKDEGPGFDWEAYMQIDPSRATDNHGRGIAQAHLHSFDQLIYNDAGNQVSTVTNLEQMLDW
ncbi:MAG: response regulator [Geminicoccaceae bacterium]